MRSAHAASLLGIFAATSGCASDRSEAPVRHGAVAVQPTTLETPNLPAATQPTAALHPQMVLVSDPQRPRGELVCVFLNTSGHLQTVHHGKFPDEIEGVTESGKPLRLREHPAVIYSGPIIHIVPEYPRLIVIDLKRYGELPREPFRVRLGHSFTATGNDVLVDRTPPSESYSNWVWVR